MNDWDTKIVSSSSALSLEVLTLEVILVCVCVQEIRPDVPKMSKKKLRRMNRLTVAELKQVIHLPAF